MDVEYEDDRLQRLETDPSYSGGYAQEAVRGFRKTMQFIRSAGDERDIRASKGLRLERLQGARADQSSVRLNKQWRLILRFEQRVNGKVVVVIAIDDYH